RTTRRRTARRAPDRPPGSIRLILRYRHERSVASHPAGVEGARCRDSRPEKRSLPRRSSVPAVGAVDWVLAGGLVALTLWSRLPYRARLLPTWDSVQFALALVDYDVTRHQPHPPGYILFVAAGRMLARLTGAPPEAALTLLAALASALTVGL